MGVGDRFGPLLLGELVEHRHVVEARAQFLHATQFGLRVRKLAGDLLRVLLVVPQLRIGRLVFEFVDAAAQLLDIENLLDRGQSGVELVEVSGNVRMHSYPGYRVNRRVRRCTGHTPVGASRSSSTEGLSPVQ